VQIAKTFQFPTGLPDAIFQTKNPNLGKFWRALQWKLMVCLHNVYLLYFMDIWHTHIVVVWWFFQFGYVVPAKIWQPWFSKTS
jgi:hypothetical protein